MRWRCLSLLCVAACGPAVGGVAEASSSSSSTSTSSVEPTGVDPSTTTDGDPTATTLEGVSSTSTSTSASTSSSSGDSSTGVDLEPVPGECDIWAQDCPAGEKCSAYADDSGPVWNAVACFPVVDDPDDPGEPCEAFDSGTSGFDSCGLGSMCWNVDDDLQGECLPLCTGSENSPSCADAERTCAIANQGALILCLQTCDPEMDACPEGEHCDSFDGAWICVPGGDPGVETCHASECDPGTVCVSADAYGPECESTACCADLCALDDPSCELPQHVCTPVYESDPPKGAENVGVCVLS